MTPKLFNEILKNLKKIMSFKTYEEVVFMRKVLDIIPMMKDYQYAILVQEISRIEFDKQPRNKAEFDRIIKEAFKK